MTKNTQAVNKYKKAVGIPANHDNFLKIPKIGKLNKNKPKMDKPMSFVALFCMVLFFNEYRTRNIECGTRNIEVLDAQCPNF
jgi:hypothetical protein